MDSESAIAPSLRRSDLDLWTHVSRYQEFRSCIRPVLGSVKPTVTCPRVSRLHFVIFRPVVEGDDNPSVPILRTWSWLYSNLQGQVTQGVRIGNLGQSCFGNRQN